LMMTCDSHVSSRGGVVDLIEYKNNSRVVFSTTPSHSPFVFQLGTSNGVSALKGILHCWFVDIIVC
jgi:hypothetical protein